MTPPAPSHPAPPARQRGQALVPALLFLVVGGAALFVAFNSQQLTSAKIKLQNTADASAYASALLQARDYNFSAYANRAMVANQAAVAQIVSLKSFVDMLDETTRPASASNSLGSRYGNGASSWIDSSRRAHDLIAPVRARVDAALPAMARDLARIVGSLSSAQRAYHEATVTSVPRLADDVARENERNTRVIDGGFDDAPSRDEFTTWRQYSTAFDPRGATRDGTRDRFADVVTDDTTLGRFVRRRVVESEAGPALRGCYGEVTRVSWISGGTQLRPDRRGWQAIDGATSQVTTEHDCIESRSYQVWIWDDPPNAVGQARRGHYETRTRTSVAYGIDRAVVDGRAGAGTGNVMSYQSWQGYGDYLNFGYDSATPGNVPLAMREQYAAGPGPSLSLDGGLPGYHDLTQARAAAAAPRITVRVARAPGSAMRERALLGGGRMALEPDSHPLLAVASGQAYFIRPEEKRLRYVYGTLRFPSYWSRSDGKTEYPSLFSPYWEARLAPVPEAMLGALTKARPDGGAR